MYRKLKKSGSRSSSTSNALKFFSVESLGVKLQFTINIFFRTAVLRKLFDIRFSYKHWNFSRVCLLVKMASKTVARSISQTWVHLMVSNFYNRHAILLKRRFFFKNALTSIKQQLKHEIRSCLKILLFKKKKTLIAGTSTIQNTYRIYSINRPGRLLNFLDLESGRLFEAARLLNFTIFSKCSMLILQQYNKR